MSKIFLVEVGPRDGLQNIKTVLPFDQKKEFIQSLLDLGFPDIEAGSFVRADRIPAMAHTPELTTHFASHHDRLWYLVPNLPGLKNALAKKVSQLAFFTAASETFNQKNIGMDLSKNFSVIQEMIQYLQDEGCHFIPAWTEKPQQPKEVKLRLYISTVIACPYEGPMASQKTVDLTEQYLPMGFSQVSLGDTIGVGTPQNWEKLLSLFSPKRLQGLQLAMHCHDTYGRALDCVQQGLDQGIRVFDSSIGGLGGCPFAPGAPGNLATEKLIHFLEKTGYEVPVSSEMLKTLVSPFSRG